MGECYDLAEPVHCVVTTRRIGSVRAAPAAQLDRTIKRDSCAMYAISTIAHI